MHINYFLKSNDKNSDSDITKAFPGFNPTTTIASSTSPLIESESVAGMSYLESLLYNLITLAFPMAVSMGFPMMLYNIVLEKEEQICDILEINGLRMRYYWIVYILYQLLICTTISLLFLVCGRLMIDMPYFRLSSFWLELLLLTFWNISQIRMALFLSTFMKSSSFAQIIGYLISVILMLAMNGMNQYCFPLPRKVPFLLLIFPPITFIRCYYLLIYQCSIGECVRHFQDAPGEFWYCIIVMCCVAFLLGFLGLVLNEPPLRLIFTKFAKSLYRCFFKLKKKEILDCS